MSTVAITQLSNLVGDVESWIKELIDAPCTEDEISVLSVVGGKLADAATFIQKKTGTLRPPQIRVGEEAWTASEKLRTQAQSAAASLASGKLSRQVVFRRNIELIFTGPKDKVLDSKEIRARKVVTRRRCEKIRKLSPDGIVIWATAYEPTLWSGGQMTQDMFECLLCNMESVPAQSMPPEIPEILQKLQADEELQKSNLCVSREAIAQPLLTEYIQKKWYHGLGIPSPVAAAHWLFTAVWRKNKRH
ncbi:hypothetical protein OIDMADRAFT_149783 [Oidiodendron maius Zn]|uniref:Uncharacterized protein n=1 Tax=Oidiodendron maius (strain Zn) TaxID=913774 RepID=A0A0C3GAF8_OIDMZ|nr:hypothetical protein OIDMADRAFT_149783 [Oidiodendron maius Zn]